MPDTPTLPTAKSGWCITKHHQHCEHEFSTFTCSCPCHADGSAGLRPTATGPDLGPVEDNTPGGTGADPAQRNPGAEASDAGQLTPTREPDPGDRDGQVVVHVGLDGQEHMLTLSAARADELRSALAPYVAVARPAGAEPAELPQIETNPLEREHAEFTGTDTQTLF